MNATEINWTPFVNDDEWIGPPAKNIGDIIIELIAIVRSERELRRVAVDRVRELQRELAGARRCHQALVDEFREFRARIMRKAAA